MGLRSIKEDVKSLTLPQFHTSFAQVSPKFRTSFEMFLPDSVAEINFIVKNVNSSVALDKGVPTATPGATFWASPCSRMGDRKWNTDINKSILPLIFHTLSTSHPNLRVVCVCGEGAFPLHSNPGQIMREEK